MSATMMNALLWALPLLPALVGATMWYTGSHIESTLRRGVLGAIGVLALTITAGFAVVAAVTSATATYGVGAGIALELAVGPVAGVMAVLVPVIALLVVAYASVHEAEEGLARLLGLLVVFTGAMLLLVVAADLLTLTVAWELVAGLSWALITHEWRNADSPRSAAHAFNVTRFGALGLFLAAGALFAETGSFGYDAIEGLRGPAIHVVAGGVMIAAITKSAQLPFSPWLFSAMAGPTSVSALLHSSTMVAAGAYILIRLQPALDAAAWFGPTTIAIGLATAIVAGIVGVFQQHAKKLLAASTSAQYGLMLVAIGAGYPSVAVIHLVVHAIFKAQLFLAAGIAMHAVGSPDLARMRLGGHLPVTAGLTAFGSLSLAAIPPLGGAWTKEEILAAGINDAVWVGVFVIVAGGLSALYAARFQLLAFGGDRRESPSPRSLVHLPNRVEKTTLSILALGSAAAGLLWFSGIAERVVSSFDGDLPPRASWELPVSLGVAVVAVYAIWTADRDGRLERVPQNSIQREISDWIAIPNMTRVGVVEPALSLATALARFDDSVVDAGVRGAASVGRAISRLLASVAEPSVDGIVISAARATSAVASGTSRFGERVFEAVVDGTAWLFDRAGKDSRRIQTGFVHHQYVVIAGGLVIVIVTAVLGR